MMKIISGGQTGVDRAALDAALKRGVDCGGWCPAGRIDEYGKIPERYPVTEIETKRSRDRSENVGDLEVAAPWQRQDDTFAERTFRNVRDSDGTVIIFHDELSGGTKQTADFCESERRPCLLLDATTISAGDAAQLIRDFVEKRNIATLNVAGPRESEWRNGYDYALRVIDLFLSHAPDVIPSEREGSRKRPL